MLSNLFITITSPSKPSLLTNVLFIVCPEIAIDKFDCYGKHSRKSLRKAHSERLFNVLKASNCSRNINWHALYFRGAKVVLLLKIVKLY